MSREQLERAYVELESTVRWILANPNLHPENIRSQMKIIAKRFNIDQPEPVADSGCFVLNVGNGG